MTTGAISGASGANRLTMWLAHRQPHILVVAIAAEASYAMSGRSPALNVLSWIALAAVFAASTATLRHSYMLCYLCAGDTPLDGPREAARRDRALRGFHFTADNPRRRIAVEVAVCVVAVGLAFLTARSWSWVPFLPLYLWWAVDATFGLRHRPVEPWCPYCKWGDGGHEEPSPEPDPVIEVEKTR